MDAEKIQCNSIHNTRALRAQTFLAKTAHNPHIAKIPDLESQHGDSDQLKNLISCSLYHCRVFLKISSKCAHNLLSNGWISNWTVSMVIRIATKNLITFFLLPWTPKMKFHRNLFITFWVMLLTDRQTNKQTSATKKHNLLTKEVISLQNYVSCLYRCPSVRLVLLWFFVLTDAAYWYVCTQA